MNSVKIKKVNLTEINILQHISKQTFFETFSEDNSEENMRKYLNEKFNNDILTSELNNVNSEFYFATVNNTVIGYIKLNYELAQTEINDKNSLEIERIYVLKEFYGKKVGQLLFDYALQIAKKTKLNYLWLGVWEKNIRAINFYNKNGFVEFNKHIFKLGDDEQTDIMMKLQLL